MNVALVIICVGGLLFGAHLLSALFDKVGVPDVLLLLLLGLGIGPIGGLVSPSDFGVVGGVFTTIALVGILFESGLGLDFARLRESMGPAVRLTVLNFVATIGCVAPVGLLVLGLSVPESVVLGSIIAGTSSAVVIPLLSKIRLGATTSTALLLESTFSDVLCIIATIGIIQALTSDAVEIAPLIGQSVASFVVPLFVGAGFGIFWSAILERVRQLENSISLTIAAVFLLFGLSELMGHSGAIASLSFGVLLGNIDVLRNGLLKSVKLKAVELDDHERAFYSELAFIIKTFFFVYVGVVMPLDSTEALVLGGLITVLVFAIRVPVVRVALRSKVTSKTDAAIASIMVPKGLAAAVLAGLPVQAGLAGGEKIQV